MTISVIPFHTINPNIESTMTINIKTQEVPCTHIARLQIKTINRNREHTSNDKHRILKLISSCLKATAYRACLDEKTLAFDL